MLNTNLRILKMIKPYLRTEFFNLLSLPTELADGLGLRGALLQIRKTQREQ
jgi:hypothetical protein